MNDYEQTKPTRDDVEQIRDQEANEKRLCKSPKKENYSLDGSEELSEEMYYNNLPLEVLLSEEMCFSDTAKYFTQRPKKHKKKDLYNNENMSDPYRQGSALDINGKTASSDQTFYMPCKKKKKKYVANEERLLSDFSESANDSAPEIHVKKRKHKDLQWEPQNNLGIKNMKKRKKEIVENESFIIGIGIEIAGGVSDQNNPIGDEKLRRKHKKKNKDKIKEERPPSADSLFKAYKHELDVSDSSTYMIDERSNIESGSDVEKDRKKRKEKSRHSPHNNENMSDSYRKSLTLDINGKTASDDQTFYMPYKKKKKKYVANEERLLSDFSESANDSAPEIHDKNCKHKDLQWEPQNNLSIEKMKKRKKEKLENKAFIGIGIGIEVDGSISDQNSLRRKDKKKKKDRIKEERAPSADSVSDSSTYMIDERSEIETGSDVENGRKKRKERGRHSSHKTSIDKMKKKFSKLEVSIDEEKCKGKCLSMAVDEKREAVQEKLKNTSFEELVEEANDLNTEKVHSLANLNVLLPWPTPLLHTVETRVAGRPTPKQRNQMELLKVDIKTGIFTQAEDNRIRRNWRKFCKLHGMSDADPTPFLNFIGLNRKHTFATEERIKFVRFLAHRLNNRMLCSVYKRFQRLFREKIKGRFTPKEDKVIIDYMKTTSSSKPFSDLAKILERDKLAVEKRCMILMEGPTRLTMKWDKRNIEVFLQNILKIVGSRDVQELKDKEITLEEWKALSKKIHISPKKLKRAWLRTIYPRVFIKETIHMKPFKKRLIDWLIENNVCDWRNTDWNNLAKQFEGFTGSKLNEIVKNMIVYHVPSEKQKDLKESLIHLKKCCDKFITRKVRKIQVDGVVSNTSSSLEDFS